MPQQTEEEEFFGGSPSVDADFEDESDKDSFGRLLTGTFSYPDRMPIVGNTPSLISSTNYIRIAPSKEVSVASAADQETGEAVMTIHHCLALRDQFLYKFQDVESPAISVPKKCEPGEGSNEPYLNIADSLIPKNIKNVTLEFVDGVVLWKWPEAQKHNRCDKKMEDFPSMTHFLTSLKHVMQAVQNPGAKSYTYKRLKYLSDKFSLHEMFNASAELQESKDNYHRDFYNVRKVDTHIHHSACMHQKHLLRFIRKKYRTEINTVVHVNEDGQEVTLRELFDTHMGISAWQTSIDNLDVNALGACFHRFDRFNTKYNPFGQKILRDVFLKTDNFIKGRFLAEITQEVIADLEDQKYQFVEWRVSIYGKSKDEWTKLGKWIYENKLYSKNVRWMIQVPRLYHVYKKLGIIDTFADFLRNIFEPIFEAVINPEEHPEIIRFLYQCTGWDSVDDESVVSKYTQEAAQLPKPEDYDFENSPPYAYWMYYLYANITSLNLLLASRGMRILPFRPHCGETGNLSHLASCFLVADSINHGVMLRKSPVLQYMYYLKQIGLAISPLSNNALFYELSKNPFPRFFNIGLNVTLSTDDPLMFHFTDEPLLEEYSCCAHVWKLTTVDLCEIARNSVLQSHFEPIVKVHWIGPNHLIPGVQGNSMEKTNVSNVRMAYRADTLTEELSHLRDVVTLRRTSAAAIQF